jgi:hypothetical protein
MISKGTTVPITLNQCLMDTSGWYPMKVLHTQVVMNTCPASLGRKDVSTGVALRQRLQQRLGLLQVGRVESLGEPNIDLCQDLVSFRVPALLLP